MKATSMSSSGTGVPLWKSPIPYLFGSLALILLLISVALIILVCSYRKRASNSAAENDEEKPAKIMNTAVDTEPKIVVVMAGDDKPSFLATPSISSTCACQQV
jgi:heme/copper-type cytochrome/quinol oxidase subunit 2